MRHAHRADVARLLDHLRHRQVAVRVRVADRRSRPSSMRPGAVWITVSGVTRPVSSAQADDERLHRRAGLEDVGQRAVAQLRAGQVAAVGRVVARVVGQRQHLAASARRARPRCRPWPCARRPRRGCAGRRRTAPSNRSTSSMSRPSTGATLSPMSSTTRPSRSLTTRRVPSRPGSCFWNASSMPSWPLSSTLVKPTTCAAASPSGYLRLYSRTWCMPLRPSASTSLRDRVVDLAAQPDEVRVVRRAGRSSSAGVMPSSLRELRALPGVGVEVLRDRPDRRRRHARRRASARCGRRCGRGWPAARACARSASRPASGRSRCR